ncbi:MAG TPA: tetratricopeptide repeat protein [Chitinivibrionales bacterium]|nr:tetratricopeptide repeat protein [Chitinivibrionales bacterium]
MSTGFSRIPRERTDPLRLPALWVLAVFVSLCGAAPQLPPEMHELAINSIDFVYKEKFKLAEDEAKKIIRKYPDHPAGYFFYAAALELWMDYYETDKREVEFYKYCDLAIEQAEKLIARGGVDKDWALFFMGGADGIKGTYESRYEKWITSFRHGWKGVSNLQQLYKRNPNIKDVLYGIGLYDYWRSALTKILWWMPGIENRCQQGINELYDAKKNGMYTCISAGVNLIDILCNEARYKEALALADELLEKYPFTLKFFWGRGAALYGSGRYNEAEGVYRYILIRVEAEPFDNHYNAVVCHYWLAKIYYKTRQYTESIAECNRMLYYTPDVDTKRRLAKYYSEAARIRAQAHSESVKSGGAKDATGK